MENPQPNKPTAIEFLGKIDSTVLAWLVFLALGGGIITLYYAHIRYLPDIEWSHSIVHLATATFVGGGFALLLALSLFVPGCIWSTFLIFDERLKDSFCFHKQTDEICLHTLWRNIGKPFAIVVVLNHFALLISQASLEGAVTLFGNPSLVNYLSFASVPLSIITLIIGAKLIRKRFDCQWNLVKGDLRPKPDEREKDRRAFKYVFWFLISVLVSQIEMLLVYLLSGRPTGLAFFITTFFCVLGALISNHFVAIHYRKDRLQCVLVSLLIAALLLFVVDRNSSLSPRILSYFGIGDMSETVDLLLNAEEKETIEKLELNNRCLQESKEKASDETQSKENDSKAKESIIRLCDVQVLSRLGNEYLLKANNRIFTLSKTAVISRISRSSPSPTPSPVPK